MRVKLETFRIGSVLLVLAALSHPAWAGEAARGEDARRWLLGSSILLLILVLMAIYKAAMVAFNLCASELKPALFCKGRTILAASPVKSFFVGLVNFILAWIIGVALIKTKVAGILGVLLLIALWLVLVVSRTLVYHALGTRLTGEVSGPEDAPSPRALCVGGIAIELGFLTPIVGWLAEVIVVLATTGALILAAISRERPAKPADE